MHTIIQLLTLHHLGLGLTRHEKHQAILHWFEWLLSHR